MQMDYQMAAGSFLVAIVVGLTGMGGGALMTPMLTMFFGVPPLTAVSSDLVAAAVMKPVGSLVHLRRGTVNLRLVGWLCLGSAPSAFCGVLVARALGDDGNVQDVIQKAMGVALLIAAGGLAVRGYLSMAERRGRRDGPARSSETAAPPAVSARPFPTILIGIIGGLLVGMTSVGSGSLIIVALLAVYPSMRANQLVGTDLVQAVPLVWAAALGHLLFGDFKLEVTAALLAGSIPGVYLGSLVSSRAPGGLIRPALAFVLLASAMKMFGVGTGATVWILIAIAAGGAAGWALLRLRSVPGPAVTSADEVGTGAHPRRLGRASSSPASPTRMRSRRTRS